MRFLILLLLLLQTGAPRPTASSAHTAILNWQNSSCTTSKPCTLQVYRAVCSSSTACPSYPNSAFTTPPSTTLAVIINATVNNTTWQATDTDPALVDNTTYVYVATNTYASNAGNPGPVSAPWSGTTSTAPSFPLAPSVGSGNSIQ